MLIDTYPYIVSNDNHTYEFVSKGPKGDITKVVEYTRIDTNIYNLGFGDKNNTTGLINDLSVSNNLDSQKVLLTVIATLYYFTGIHKNAEIFATGSTEARTRLYQIGITKNLIKAEEDFTLYGFINNEWEVFNKDTKYSAFYVKRKN